MRALAVAALALVLAGCGRAERGHGTATLWVTRDRGAHVIFDGTVPAGLTAMQALDRKLDVKTRYGGRFVQAIEGIDGSVTRRSDWFWYVNGIEGDRSAAEYRLRDGDVEWWDFRSWRKQLRVPVVVGAFPEPFLHGFGGVKRGGCVLSRTPLDDGVARRLTRLIGGRCRPGNQLIVDNHVPPRAAQARRVGNRVELVLGVEAAVRLARNPDALRYRYEVRG